MAAVEGTWVGRLIDAGGFEGDITLTLEGEKDGVAGLFDALIAGQHHPTRIRGRVSGTQKRDGLSLRVDMGQSEAKTAIAIKVDLFKTRQGTPAACGVYAVSARSSALMGGVISVRQSAADKQQDAGFVRTAVAHIPANAGTPNTPAPAPKRGGRTAKPKTRTSKSRRSR